MARQIRDKFIGAVLNHSGKQTVAATAGHECAYVLSATKRVLLPIERGEHRARGKVTLNEAADFLAILSEAPSAGIRSSHARNTYQAGSANGRYGCVWVAGYR
jgi:hypothetical protein